MRLIDAYKLIEDIKNNLWDWKSVDGITSTTVLKQMISDIKNQPTIEAIPMEKPFLKMRYGDYVVYNKKWLVNHLQTEWDILQGKEYKPAIPIEWVENWKRGKTSIEQVVADKIMMDYKYRDWEKENDIIIEKD